MENISQYFKYKCNSFKTSDKTFAHLYEIIVDQEDRIFCEYLENYRIKNVSYKQFDSYTKKLANYYKSILSKDLGNYVGLYLENSVNLMSSLWALLMIGKRPILLNCKLPNALNRNVCNLLKAEAIISNDEQNAKEIMSNVLALPKGIGIIKEFDELEELKEYSWENAIALTTTATTMDYKICVYSGEELFYQVTNAEGIVKQNDMIKRHYDHKLKLLAFLPIYHIFGLVAMYLWFSLFGRTFVLLQNYASNTILQTIKRHNVTHIFAVPLLWNTIAKEIKKEVARKDEKLRAKFEKGIKLSLALQSINASLGEKFARKAFAEVIEKTLGNSIKFLISGGGYIPTETLRIINGIGYPLYNGYGATEIGITSVELRKGAKYRLLGSVGKPFDSVEYRIENGELFVKGESLCSTIISKEGNITQVDKKVWHGTKDMAREIDGYYYIDGRGDDVIVGANGEKINPDIIEKQILIKEIENYCILNYENATTLIFEAQKNMSILAMQNVYDVINKTLSALKDKGFDISKVYFTFDAIADKNAIKVSRKILLNKIENKVVSLHPISEMARFETASIQEIEDDLEKKIKSIIANVLNTEEATIKNDSHIIYDLGGTSLDYCALLLKLEEEFGISFDLTNAGFTCVNVIKQYILDNQKRK